MSRMSRFQLGRFMATPGARNALAPGELSRFLGRHSLGDWGELDRPDRDANEAALATGARLLSAYTTRQGARVWIITEADRSATMILLPEEY